MVSLFYSSNEKKQRKYIKDRRMEEVNEENQQQIVDDAIARDLGFEQKATKLGKLAKRVIDKVGNEVVDDLIPTSIKTKLLQLNMSPFEFLKKSIENGTLSQLFDKLKSLPNSVLNRRQQLIRDDLNNPEIKSLINDELAAVASSGSDNIAKILLEALGGDESNEDILDMIEKVIAKLKANIKANSEVKAIEDSEKLALAQTRFNPNLGRQEIPRGPKKGSKNKTKKEKEELKALAKEDRNVNY